MDWSTATAPPSRRTLRGFAGLGFVLLTAWGFWTCLGHARPVLGLCLTALGSALGVAGLLRPRSLRPIYAGWMIAVFPVGWITSRLLLSAVYLAVFMPLGLFFRLAGRDPLERRFDSSRTSYWEPRKPEAAAGSYLRQF